MYMTQPIKIYSEFDVGRKKVLSPSYFKILNSANVDIRGEYAGEAAGDNTVSGQELNMVRDITHRGIPVITSFPTQGTYLVILFYPDAQLHVFMKQ